MSIQPLFEKDLGPRPKPIPFHYKGKAALIDNDYKIVVEKIGGDRYKLFDLVKDKKEEKDLSAERPELAKKMKQAVDAMVATVAQSQKGADYPEGKVTKEGPHGQFWYAVEAYKPHLELFGKRPEYKKWVERGKEKKKK